VVEAYPRVVNLHIALLPWNRGRNPNFWSWLENTPKGVTIHHIDDGIDTGPVLAQEEVQFDEDKETLASSYRGLKDKVETLFIEFWRQISTDGARTAPQRGKGTYHSGIEFEDYKNLLSLGWDTPVREIKRYGKEGGLWVLNERGERIK
jgi:methionyl-tRNA formyltransferase